MENKISYHAEGFLLGNLWGGGKGAYPTIKLTSDSIYGIRELAENALSDGSLDSGMGYQSLIGAILKISISSTVFVFLFHNKTTVQQWLNGSAQYKLELINGMNVV